MMNSKEAKGTEFTIGIANLRSSSASEYFNLSLDEDKVIDWPMVYILNDSKKAYIGQTTNLARRMTEHSKSEEKRDLEQLNAIFHPKFNMSVVTDYESRIIQLMFADEKFKILNKNDGLKDSNYFLKNEYGDMFKDLWSQLQMHNIVEQSIDEIEQSAIFKFSPYKELNPDQTYALAKIQEAIDAGKGDPILVEGQPGTGKTILAIYLLKLLRDDKKFAGKNIKLVIPQAGLRATISDVFKRTQSLDPNDVIGPFDLIKPELGYKEGCKPYDILIVDEAHRLNKRQNIVNYQAFDKVTGVLGMEKGTPQIDWILHQAKLPIFFFDSLQHVGPSGTSKELFSEKLNLEGVEQIALESQMRVKGGKDYLDYVLAILNNKLPHPISDFGGEYELKLFTSFSRFNDFFHEVQTVHSLTRMLAGYSWDWTSKKDPEAFDIKIEGVKKRWNSKYSDWISKGFSNPEHIEEVGCIHTSQGYDLSYAFVILGNDIQFDEHTNQIRINKASYYDRNGKATASYDDLEQYIKNIYYVLLTRGMFGTYIYACDPGMQGYLSRFMSVI